MPHLITYDLRGRGRGKDRKKLVRHLKKVGAKKVQRTVWYLADPHHTAVSLVQNLQSVRRGTKKPRSVLQGRDRILAAPFNKAKWKCVNPIVPKKKL